MNQAFQKRCARTVIT